MFLELQPWVKANLASTGSEQHWLLGFSKSGFGGLDLLLKHPDLFTLGAFWDFPATGLVAYDQLGEGMASNYGTDANFQANYRMTAAFLQAHTTSFLSDNRIWIQGYNAWQTEVDNFHTALTGQGIAHTYTSVLRPTHSWDAGWVPSALTGLYTLSIGLGNPVGPAQLPNRRTSDSVTKTAVNGASANLHKRMRAGPQQPSYRHSRAKRHLLAD